MANSLLVVTWLKTQPASRTPGLSTGEDGKDGNASWLIWISGISPAVGDSDRLNVSTVENISI